MSQAILLKVIADKCKECCCGDKAEVKACEITKCSLHKYRLGTNPNKKTRVLSDEKRAEIGARLAAGRAASGAKEPVKAKPVKKTAKVAKTTAKVAKTTVKAKTAKVAKKTTKKG